MEKQMAGSFILLKFQSATDGKSPVFLAYEVKCLTLVECLIHHLRPLDGGKDVILVNIQELV